MLPRVVHVHGSNEPIWYRFEALGRVSGRRSYSCPLVSLSQVRRLLWVAIIGCRCTPIEPMERVVEVIAHRS
jgi:hypothetical protein